MKKEALLMLQYLFFLPFQRAASCLGREFSPAGGVLSLEESLAHAAGEFLFLGGS